MCVGDVDIEHCTAITNTCCGKELHKEVHVALIDGIEKIVRVDEQFGKGVTAKGVECRVVEGVKHDALRWFRHVMRRGENESVKRLYEARVELGWGRSERKTC